MKPNILFILVDSLRADKSYGLKKSSVTPNLDNLIKNGSYFTNAISASDGTYVSLGSIFTGQHPFNHGVTWFENHSNVKKSFKSLKQVGYTLNASVQDHPFFETLTSEFDGKDLIDASSYERIFEGFGEKILNRLKLLKSNSPWFYYIHIMDLHVAKKLPAEYSDSKFGSNSFDKRLSIIDIWLGKFLELIDKENTLIILTADHGEFEHDVEFGSIPELQKALKKLQSITPKALEPLGLKIFEKFRDNINNRKISKLKKNLSEDESRYLLRRGEGKLFDDTIHVPLLFSGFGVSNHRIISQQVRHIDILPTILDIASLDRFEWIDGTSLEPLFRQMNISESPAYIESVPLMNQELGDTVGIRTSEFKYCRSRSNTNEDIFLYNLILDPNESTNIAKEKNELVKKFENTLQELKNTGKKQTETEKMDLEKIDKAKQILKELGYDK